ncbi:ATP-binding protein [Trueperella bernardiae]|uniref:AlbA family DNA-binding domain-containing protein n=1 Tax=Trueperella bernardiae TaxID=59561 RepID=UPI0029490586|nr:ATP-binding protein [Trueperella bernardiae]MDV6239653.1 ATP-binding protein [Trueperella bernardiae]
MATSALHRELGEPASTPVTYDLLCKLVEYGVREQADLDFKQELYHPRNEKQKQELVKDVCAMANTGGGWIICGIAEKDSAAATVIGVDLENTSETDVHQMLENRLDPPVTVGIRVYESVDREKTLVSIRIPNSPEKPHLARVSKSEGQELVDTRAFRVPRRKGASTVWLDERAIRTMYREAFSISKEARDLRIHRLDELATKAAEEFPGVALALVLSPHDPLSGRLDKQEVQKLLQEIDSARFAQSQGYSNLRGIFGALTVGDRRYTGKQSSNHNHALIEIDFDGTIAIAIQLAVDEPNPDHRARGLYTNQPDETTQNEIEYALVEAFNCASQLSNSLNPTSDSELHVRLVPYGVEPIIIRRNEGAWAGNLIRPRDESTPIKNFRTVSHPLPASPTSAEEQEILTDLVTEVLNQGGIETIHLLQPLQQG